MDYNTTRSKLLLSEYGRHVQDLLDFAMQIEDREKRTRVAGMIVQVMSQVNPGVRENNDYKQKLWDQLHIMSDFKLDVDSPFPIPEAETLQAKPEKLSYRNRNFKYGHYGKNIIKIIMKAAELEDSPEKDLFVEAIANHLKKTFLTWNRDSVNDEVIYANLNELSKGKLTLHEDAKLHHTDTILARTTKKKKFNRPKDNQTHRRNRKNNP